MTTFYLSPYILVSNPMRLQQEGIYSVKNALKWLNADTPRLQWARQIWSSYGIPKHKFISWIALQNRLQTRQRLHKHSIVENSLCPLCEDEEESMEHLFFNCPFSVQFMSCWQTWIKYKINCQSIQQLIRSIRRCKKANSKQRKMLVAAVVGAVYCIWHARNTAVWEGYVPRPESVFRRMKFDVRYKLRSDVSAGFEVCYTQCFSS